MYDRTIKKQDLTFQVSGMLWNRSLVMRDLETKTLWSHLLGRGMKGTHKDVQLEMIPASMTTWSDWKKRHPQTSLLAMPRTSRRYLDKAWENPRSFVFGIPLGIGKPAPAVTFEKLQTDQVVMLQIGKESLVVTYQGNGGSIQAFHNKLNNELLTFSSVRDGFMKDKQTGSEWNVVTGQAISGKYKGTRLIEIPGTVSYNRAWRIFHPDDQVIE